MPRAMKDFIVDPVPAERPSRAGSEALLTLASLEGRLPDRVDGRPRRTKVIATNLRKRFMEVLDDQGDKILVYITEDGKVRRDVQAVQDELEAAGEFKGMRDAWEVDIGEMMDDSIKVVPRPSKKRRRDDDDEEDQFDDEEEDEEEEEQADSDDREAIEEDEEAEDSDADFEATDEDDDVSEEYEEDNPDDLKEEVEDLVN